MDGTNYSRVCSAHRRVRILAPGELPQPGAHLIVPWLGFTHHGICAGSDRVVHYGALLHDIFRRPVEEVSLAEFAEGRPVFVVEHDELCFRAEEAVSRARSRLGENRYRLFSNNCEHFVEWCLHDVSRSFQAETALAFPGLMGERIESALLRVLRWAFSSRVPARVRIESRHGDEN
jgi:hypothetical protein